MEKRIVQYNEDKSIKTVIMPSPEALRNGLTLEEIAILSIHEIREQLDKIMLGIESLEDLITYTEKEEEYTEQERKLIRRNTHGVKQDVVIVENVKKKRKVKIANTTVYDGICKQVEEGNITICKNIDPDTKQRTLYTQETPKAFLKRKDIDVLKVKYNFEIVEEVPDEREYFDSYKLDGNKVNIDLEKAKALHVGIVRKQRNEKLKKLDQDFVIAERNKDSKTLQVLELIRKRLLDAPQNMEKANKDIKTLEQLKGYSVDTLVEGE